jgi:hypothetical protein
MVIKVRGGGREEEEGDEWKEMGVTKSRKVQTKRNISRTYSRTYR